MACLIFTNGDYGDYGFCKDIRGYEDIICADNGMKHARYLKIMPQLIVGDFDSSQESDLTYFESQKVPILRFLPAKDETDTEIAIDQAIERGADRIDIYGGAGTRLDHTLANVHLLYKGLKQKVKIRLINAYNEVNLIDSFIEIEGQPGDIISLLPFSQEVSGIYTQNLGYALTNGTLSWEKPCGVSNYMLKTKASVKIEKGLLLVIKGRDQV